MHLKIDINNYGVADARASRNVLFSQGSELAETRSDSGHLDALHRRIFTDLE